MRIWISNRLAKSLYSLGLFTHAKYTGVRHPLPPRWMLTIVLGEVLEKRRRDRRHPPRDANLTMRQLEVCQLQEQLVHLMDNCPPQLSLDQIPDRTLL